MWKRARVAVWFVMLATGPVSAEGWPKGQGGIAVGGLRYTGEYDGTYGSLMATAYGGFRLQSWLSVGMRASVFHGGETRDSDFAPTFETTHVPLMLTARLEAPYVWIELATGTSLRWIERSDGATEDADNVGTRGVTVGITVEDPAMHVNPELSVGLHSYDRGEDAWSDYYDFWLSFGLRFR